MNRADRLMAYLLLFQSRGLLRARDFSARFEVSEWTVYRIDDLTISDHQFSPRVITEPALETKPITIVVRFDASIVRWVRERQHYSLVEDSSQSDQPVPGDAIMVYRPRALAQIEGWLLGWGDKMEVLEPLVMREQLAAVAAGILGRHQKQS